MKPMKGICVALLGGLLMLVGWRFAASTPTALESASWLDLRSLTGRDGNGLCCHLGGGAMCESQPEYAICVPSGTGGQGCDCALQGSLCSQITVAPVNHDICEPSQGDPTDPNCTLVSTFCYVVKWGHCYHDAGPWSLGCLGHLCGCVYDGNEEIKGSKNVCGSGSTGC